MDTEPVPRIGRPPGGSGGGLQYGWTEAAYIALNRPDLYGNVISHSGSFWWSAPGEDEPEQFAREVSRRQRVPVRFYLDAGLLEGSAQPSLSNPLQANRHLRTLLSGLGYDVTYAEHNCGHDYFYMGHRLPRGLIAALGRPPEPDQ